MDNPHATLGSIAQRHDAVAHSASALEEETTLNKEVLEVAPRTEESSTVADTVANPTVPTRHSKALIGQLGQQKAILLGGLAFLAGGTGEALLFSDASRPAGTAVLGLGMVLAAIAWRGTRDAPLFSPGDNTRWWRFAFEQPLALRLVGILGALGLGVASIRSYMADPGAIFGLQGVFWLLGMALLIISCARWRPSNEALEPGPRWTRIEVVGFTGLLALSLFTHLAFLAEIPWRLHFDEGFAYLEVMRYYRGPAIPLFTTTWEGTTLPSLYFGFEGLLAHIVGPGIAGVRLGVALAGALTVVPVYALARLSWGRLAAVLAGFGVSVSAVYVHYSRVSILNVTTPLWWTACFYFLLRGLRTRRPLDFALAGLIAGTSMYTYYGTRLLPLVLLTFAIYLFTFHFRAFRERVAHWGLLLVGFVIGFGPLLGYFFINPSAWFSRSIAFLDVPAVIPTTWEGWVNDWNILAPLVGQNFLGLSVVPGKDTVYYAPFLLPPEAVLLILGVGLLIWRWRQPASFLVLLWGMSVVMTGGTLLDYPTIPNFAHWTPAFPAFFLAMALPLALWVRALLQQPRRLVRRAVVAALTLLLIADLGANAYAYLVLYPQKVPPDTSLHALDGRYVESVGPNVHVRVVGDTWTWTRLNAPIGQMMAAPNTTQTRFFNASRELPVVGDPKHGLAFTFFNDTINYLPLVESYYPGGQVGELRTPGSDVIGTSYRVSAEHALAGYGAMLSIGDPASSENLWSGIVETVGAFPGNIDLPRRFLATWSGAIYVGGDGVIKLSTSGMQGAEIRLLGTLVSPDAPITFEPGWVQYSVRALFERATPAALLVQQGDATPMAVDKYHLWPTPIGQGLRVTLGGAPTWHRVDPSVASAFSRPPVVDSSNADFDSDLLPLVSVHSNTTYTRWEGELLTQDGMYTMMLRTDAIARLDIDGTTVVQVCVASPGSQPGTIVGQVQLSAGWHQVQIDFTPAGFKNGLEWFWTRPDGVTEVVPPSALRIGPDITPVSSFPQWPELPASTCGP